MLHVISRKTVFVVVLLILGFTALANFTILDSNPYDGDGRQYVTIAYNLKVHGVFALEDQSPLSPTNVREPAYPFLLALLMAPLGIDQDTDLQCLVGMKAGCERERLYLKLADVATQLLIGLAGSAILWCLTGNVWATLAIALLLGSSTGLLTFTNIASSEVLSAFWMLIHSWGLRQIVSGNRPRLWAIMGGLVLGLLVLTKTVFLLWLGLLAAAGAGLLVWRAWRTIAIPIILTAAIAAAVVSGWVARNYTQLDTFAVSQRGAQVLALRAQYGSITGREYISGYLYFTPLVGQALLDRFFTPADWKRFVREAPDGFKAGASGEQSLALRMNPNDPGQGAVMAILADLPIHLALVPLLTYQAAFLQVGFNTLQSGDGGLGDVLVIASMVTHVLFVPAFLLLTVRALRRRCWPLIAFLAPSIYGMALHAVATHYIPRYNAPLLAVMAVALVLLAVGWLRRGGSAKP